MLQPVFKVSFNVVNDVMRNKILEELLETSQEMIKKFINCLYKLSQPKPEPSCLEKVYLYWKDWILSFFYEEVKKKRLFSDLVKQISKCEPY